MARNCAGRSTASVMTKPSVVAIIGWIIPLPFVMPATRTAPRRRRASAKAVLGTRSVVIMARATASKPSARSPLTRRGRASMILRGSSSTPITPVEEGTTWVTGRRRSLAAALHVDSATASPVRVAQLALPALITTAPHRPLDAFRWLRPRRTGAACTRFCVKTAAALAGNPLTISAKSSFATCRIPAYVAAYAYPSGSFKSVALLKHHCPSTAARWRNPRRRSACGLPTALPEAPGCRLRRPLPGASCRRTGLGPEERVRGVARGRGRPPHRGTRPCFSTDAEAPLESWSARPARAEGRARDCGWPAPPRSNRSRRLPFSTAAPSGSRRARHPAYTQGQRLPGTNAARLPRRGARLRGRPRRACRLPVRRPHRTRPRRMARRRAPRSASVPEQVPAPRCAIPISRDRMRHDPRRSTRHVQENDVRRARRGGAGERRLQRHDHRTRPPRPLLRAKRGRIAARDPPPRHLSSRVLLHRVHVEPDRRLRRHVLDAHRVDPDEERRGPRSRPEAQRHLPANRLGALPRSTPRSGPITTTRSSRPNSRADRKS